MQLFSAFVKGEFQFFCELLQFSWIEFSGRFVSDIPPIAEGFEAILWHTDAFLVGTLPRRIHPFSGGRNAKMSCAVSRNVRRRCTLGVRVSKDRQGVIQAP